MFVIECLPRSCSTWLWNSLMVWGIECGHDTYLSSKLDVSSIETWVTDSKYKKSAILRDPYKSHESFSKHFPNIVEVEYFKQAYEILSGYENTILVEDLGDPEKLSEFLLIATDEKIDEGFLRLMWNMNVTPKQTDISWHPGVKKWPLQHS